MKKLVQVQEVDGEGLVALLGEKVVLFCMNYFYTGLLEGVNEKDVKLTNASIVYETGSFTAGEWKNAEALPRPIYVRLDSLESYMKVD